MLASLTLLSLATSPAFAAEELEVKVYEGPTECEAENMVEPGDKLAMHYTGTIDASSATGKAGSEFDSSRNRGRTFDFVIGGGRVIQGWDKGLLGLCKGAKATLIIPPTMGYGESGAGAAIPGGATLNFDVEVVGITKKGDVADGREGGPPDNLFEELDTDKDGRLTADEVLEFFKKNGQDELPEGLMEEEDKDGDGFITWEEFGGPKGTGPPSAAADAKDDL